MSGLPAPICGCGSPRRAPSSTAPGPAPTGGRGLDARIRRGQFARAGPWEPRPLNILFVTLDQFRGDCLSCAGHPIVRTPNLDRLAAEGVRFARHYSQAAPCGPGRASLYTGLYQMNHRVVTNGTPLDARFDTVALAARRAGYAPGLFGYTDQALDPRVADGPDDPRLATYEGVLPGFDEIIGLPSEQPLPWLEALSAAGYDVSGGAEAALAGERDRPAELSMAAFLTDGLIDRLPEMTAPWFIHLSQLRPHPPFSAAGRFSSLYPPEAAPDVVPPPNDPSPLHAALLREPRTAAPSDPAALAALRAQYFGMVSEVDYQFCRLRAALEASGAWGETFVVVTSDHGEQLGDHGLLSKFGFFEQSFHIPLIIRDPRPSAARGRVVEAFTEAVDVFPTLCEVMDIPVPAACDGLSLGAYLAGREPPWWREAAHWEFDWRGGAVARGDGWPWDRRLARRSLAVRRTHDAAFVQFADGTSLAFDLASDPTWRTPIEDPERRFALASAMLAWRAEHADRTLTGMRVQDRGAGRWPPTA